MRVSAVGVVLALTVMLTACGASTSKTGTSTSDCAAQVRLGGAVYTAYVSTRHAATRYAAADLAECDDVGKDSGGSVFPDTPDQVAMWSFRGYPQDKVLGVRRSKASFAVYVAENVTQPERDRILHALGVEKR